MREPTDPPIERLLLWLGCLGLALAAALAALIPVAWLASSPLPDRQGQLRTVVVAPPPPIDFQRFALHGLLAPLIDDAGRWTDMALDFMCDPDTRVLVDGQALMPGESVPTHAFTLRWDMGHCQPYGQAIALTGAVRLVVSRGDAGLVARVMPERLWIHGPAGRVAIDRPFMTTLSLAPSAHEP